MSWPNDVRKGDLEVEFVRGSGPGGQNRDKRATACRITHRPTGISARAEDQKSQARNRRSAFRRLAERLVPLMRTAARRSAPSGTPARVRTYHFPRGTVTAHPSGYMYPLGSVLEGNLDQIHRDILLGGRENP